MAARPLDVVLSRKAVELMAMFVAAMFFAYVFMAVKFMLAGKQTYHFGDFFALWTSAVVTHAGDAAVNFDADALHARQVALGMNPDGYNPFPYPPSFLLLLGPLGGLPLHLAFYVFMVPSFVAYVLAMTLGRWREWWWALGAVIAPATGITLISGQTGFLSGALMVGGLRLLPTRPALAGVLFGLLAYKPQLGVLVPVALVAMGAWRAIAAAAATVSPASSRPASSTASRCGASGRMPIVEYATRFHPVVGYMPTIYANAIMLGRLALVAWVLQLAVSIPVGDRGLARVRAGAERPRGGAAGRRHLSGDAARLQLRHADDDAGAGLVLRRAVSQRGAVRRRRDRRAAARLHDAVPHAEAEEVGMPMSWAPLGLMFCLIAWPRPTPPAAEALAQNAAHA